MNMESHSIPSHLQIFRPLTIYPIITTNRPTPNPLQLHLLSTTNSPLSVMPSGAVNLVVQLMKAHLYNFYNFVQYLDF